MNEQIRFAYAQARLQARHGERPTEEKWKELEASKSFSHYLKSARKTGLTRFTSSLSREADVDVVERVLKEGWSSYVREVAGWVPQSWSPAIIWLGYIPDLPALDSAARRHVIPNWMREDKRFLPFTIEDARSRSDAVERSGLAPLAPALNGERTIGECWFVHWLKCWPDNWKKDRQKLLLLADLVIEHVDVLARTKPRQSTGLYRQLLSYRLTTLFRRHCQTPLSVFCHLGLVALDLERLRGGLVRRNLFRSQDGKEAA